MNICELLFWEKGERFVKQICTKKLQVRATGLIGTDYDQPRKNFMNYEVDRENGEEGKSRFATFEISFEGGNIEYTKEFDEEDIDEKLDIIN